MIVKTQRKPALVVNPEVAVLVLERAVAPGGAEDAKAINSVKKESHDFRC